MNKKALKILNSAIQLLLRDGVKMATMDDIAGYANASKGTIYKYFKDKDSLYFEIGKHIFTNYTEQLESVVSSGDALIQKLYAFMDRISDFINSGKYDLCEALIQYNYALDTVHNRYMQTYRDTMLSLIDEGTEKGLLKCDLSRELIFHYIDMGIVYYRQNPSYREKMLRENDFQKRFMLFFISNIFVDGAKIVSAR
ncbi:MAG: TetR/AcrR family transcriptional regulator [Bacillota bacterium]